MKFRAAFKKSFGEAPWYHHITGMEVADGRLEITPDLGPGNGKTAGTICGVAIKFAFDSGAVDEFQSARRWARTAWGWAAAGDMGER